MISTPRSWPVDPVRDNDPLQQSHQHGLPRAHVVGPVPVTERPNQRHENSASQRDIGGTPVVGASCVSSSDERLEAVETIGGGTEQTARVVDESRAAFLFVNP